MSTQELEAKTKESINFGGWSQFTSKIDATAQKAFNDAMKNHVGVKYSDFAVSQQVVAGMNYIFLCNGATITLPVSNGLYSVHIFQNLKGESAITKIVPLTSF